MAKVTTKIASSLQRARRVRSTVIGSAERPRLSVHISNLHVSAQLIDDASGKTLAAASTVGSKTKDLDGPKVRGDEGQARDLGRD